MESAIGTMTAPSVTNDIDVDNLPSAERPTYRGRPLPWSIIGTDFRGADDISVREAIQQAQADYTVSAQPVVRVPQDIINELLANNEASVTLTREQIVRGYKSTFREDNGFSMGCVSDRYGIVQNDKAFDVLDFLEEVSGIKPKIDNVGVLDGGARIYVACRFGEDYDLGGGDIVENYVVFTNTHDGSGSVMCFFTPIRVWCQNTLNAAIRETKNKLVYAHTSKVGDRLNFTEKQNREYAAAILKESITFGEKFREAMERMKSQRVTPQEVQDFAARIYLNDKSYKLYETNGFQLEGVAEIPTVSKNNVRNLIDTIDRGVGQQAHRDTRLWLYNGLTTYLHNEKTYENAESEFKATMDGSVKLKVQRAFDLLTA